MSWQGIRRRTTQAPQLSRKGAAASPDLYSRNWAFIDRDLQDRLAKTTLFTAGNGLGSVIACLAARTGFQRFVLADGDVVEESNLNRQSFVRGQLGHNKATATAALISAICPSASIEVIPQFVGAQDFDTLLPKADIIVNTIDMDNEAFLELNRMCRTFEKPVLFPINIGWGGGTLVFTKDSMSLDEFIEDAPGDEVATRVVRGVLARMPSGMPSYLGDLLPQFINRTQQSWPFDPQLGVAAHITSALAVQAAVALVAGFPIRTAPDIAWCDARASLQPLHGEPVAANALSGSKERLHV